MRYASVQDWRLQEIRREHEFGTKLPRYALNTSEIVQPKHRRGHGKRAAKKGKSNGEKWYRKLIPIALFPDSPDVANDTECLRIGAIIISNGFLSMRMCSISTDAVIYGTNLAIIFQSEFLLRFHLRKFRFISAPFPARSYEWNSIQCEFRTKSSKLRFDRTNSIISIDVRIHRNYFASFDFIPE